jgi:hypothetical protein
MFMLGLVLYRLVAGRLPYWPDTDGSGQRVGAADDIQPVPPSTASGNRQLAGDLDSIILKALRNRPEERYASAQEFSDDLDRFLRDLPIKAGHEGQWYRGRKFLKRNRTLLSVAMISAVAAVGLVIAPGRIGMSLRKATAVRPVNGPDWDHWQFEKLAAVGDPAPGGGTYTRFFEQSCINNRGDIAFSAQIAGREAVFLRRRGEPTVQLARGDEPAPGGGTFDREIAGFTMNGSGDMVFAFGLKPLRPPELKGFMKHGLFRHSHAERTRADHHSRSDRCAWIGRFSNDGSASRADKRGRSGVPGGGTDAARRFAHGEYRRRNLSHGSERPGHKAAHHGRSGA